jgi:5-methylcytosine-specific restriction endonuclease McrA
MLSMNAKFRGWCNYYKYANNPQGVFHRIAYKMWGCYAHFLTRKHRSSKRALLIRAKKNGSHRVITKGTSKQGTFTIELGKGKHIYLDVVPPKSEEIRQVSNKETWTVDLKPVNPDKWLQGRSAATRLSALARNGGICQRCGENPARQAHHKNRMKTKRTVRAKVASDRDQREQAQALCKECHLAVHHGTWQG